MKPSYEHDIGKIIYNEEEIPLSAGKSEDEWQPNPTWWDIEKILAEDTRDYPYKAAFLLGSTGTIEETLSFNAEAYATSDGAFYELETSGAVTHNWDLSKDKPCLINGTEAYKTRYIIVYYNNQYGASLKSKNSLYVCFKGDWVINSQGFGGNYALEGVNSSSPLYCGGRSAFLTFSNNSALRKMCELDTSAVENFAQMFENCFPLQTIPQLDTSSGTNFSNMFHYCVVLQTIPELNTSKGTIFSSMFSGCYSLKAIPQLDTSSGTTFSSMFSGCYSLKAIPQLDTSSGTNFSSMFNGCRSIQIIPQLDTSSGTNFSNMFYQCNTVQIIGGIDLLNATNVTSMLYTPLLRSIMIKNIRISLQIGSGTSYGHLLTLDSLTNAIKELWDNSTGTSTLTLTVGTANLTKLANVYVKLVDITDEMRAEDEYIDNKKPFVVCESTDEGAMLITEYVTSKNWQIK